MSTTLKFTLADKTFEINNNPKASIALASLKKGSAVRITDDDGFHTGKVSTISVSGDEKSVIQTFELTPTKQTQTAPVKKRANAVAATIFIKNDGYLITDEAALSAYTSQAQFEFKKHQIDNSSPVVEIQIFGKDDVTVDLFINQA